MNLNTSEDDNATEAENQMTRSFDSIVYTFMSAMDARANCESTSMVHDINTEQEHAMTLYSKDSFLPSFLVDFFDVNNTCMEDAAIVNNGTNVSQVILSNRKCKWYELETESAEDICTNDTVTFDHGTNLSYYDCLWYQFMVELGARNVCESEVAFQMTESCKIYIFVMGGILSGTICIIGLITNLFSLGVFCHGIVKTPVNYQFQWLAFVDSIFLSLCLVIYAPGDIMIFVSDNDLNLYGRGIFLHVEVYVEPFVNVARTSTIWFTVFIGIYRYLAICKSSSNVYGHLVQHGHKYVVLIFILANLYTVPYFLEEYLVLNVSDNKANFVIQNTDLGKNEICWLVYYFILCLILLTCLPYPILVIATVKMLSVLRKRQKVKRNMQSSPSSQSSINAILIVVLVTFIICQVPYFVFIILYSLIDYQCGSVTFYSY